MGKTVNKRIERLRTSLELTKTEFGRLLRMHTSAISRLENGENNPTEKTLQKIIEMTNADEAWLFNGEGPMFGIGDVDSNKILVRELLAKGKTEMGDWKKEAYVQAQSRIKDLELQVERAWAAFEFLKTNFPKPLSETALRRLKAA